LVKGTQIEISRLIFGMLVIGLFLAGCRHDAVRFAVIGDFGCGLPPAQDVSNLVKSLTPDFIITTGDNNYPSGAAETIDQNIGQWYSDFIFPYRGRYGAGGSINGFFPSLGNHDWETDGVEPYLDYFALPHNERYYDFVWGPVHLFAIDSDPQEPDGNTSASVQGDWLQRKLAGSASRWKLVYMHHPPYSSGKYGSGKRGQWPYQRWGATGVLAGHDHTYERIIRDGIPYFVNGLGGCEIYEFRRSCRPAGCGTMPTTVRCWWRPTTTVSPFDSSRARARSSTPTRYTSAAINCVPAAPTQLPARAVPDNADRS
jgi:tartrate-resistant acid phosphatase type 5